jgi:HlyD family secretion protein
MKKAIPIFVVLVTGLSILLYLRLREQRREAERPSGGSATVEGTQVDVVARMPARIHAVKVREGQAVEKGQVVVELQCDEQRALLAQAEAALQGARVAADAARTQQKLSRVGERGAKTQVWMAYAAARAAEAQKKALAVQRGVAYRTTKRLEKVHEAGAISDQQFDQTQSQVKGLDRQLKALRANIDAAQARAVSATTAKRAAQVRVELSLLQRKGAQIKIQSAQAAVDRARVAVGECTLRAPRAGYVLRRNYEPGEVVLPGSRVLSLVDTRQVKATFYLPNDELSAAKPGRAVKVEADAYADRTFEGKIRWVAAEAEFTPRNVQTREDRDRLVYAVEVSIPNPKGLLRPGMPVEITIPGTSGAR